MRFASRRNFKNLLDPFFHVTSVSSSWLFQHLCSPIVEWNVQSVPACRCHQLHHGAAQTMLGPFLPFHLAAIASKSRQRILGSLWFCLFAIQSLHSFQYAAGKSFLQRLEQKNPSKCSISPFWHNYHTDAHVSDTRLQGESSSAVPVVLVSRIFVVVGWVVTDNNDSHCKQ